MANPIELPIGVTVEDTTSVAEGYMVETDDQGSVITININPARLCSLLDGFIRLLVPAGFFFLELPAEPKEQPEGGYATYYLDGCTIEVLLAIVERYGALLVNDGIVRFGFASHSDGEELYCADYKVVKIYTTRPRAYEELLEGLELERRQPLKTLWDCFTQDNPGEVCLVTVDDETVFDMMENLREAGLYQAK